MTRLILITLLAIFTLGNSAGGLGGLIVLAGGAIIGLIVCIGIVWGLIKWLS